MRLGRTEGSAPLAVISGRPPRSRALRSDRQLSRFRSFLWIERRRRGWSTAQMAQRLGIRPARLADWESGKRCPSEAQLPAVAAALGMNVEGLRFLRAASEIERRIFNRGAASIEEIHGRVVAFLESLAAPWTGATR